jgi:hypothetical protein
VRIDGLGTPNLPIAPATAAGRAASAPPINTALAAAAQALQQEEQKGGGGGGGGHGHAKKAALDSIDQIAARASLNIEERKRTMLERMREIEKLKAELAAEAEKVGEKDPDARDEQQQQQEAPEDEPEGGELA